MGNVIEFICHVLPTALDRSFIYSACLTSVHEDTLLEDKNLLSLYFPQYNTLYIVASQQMFMCFCVCRKVNSYWHQNDLLVCLKKNLYYFCHILKVKKEKDSPTNAEIVDSFFQEKGEQRWKTYCSALPPLLPWKVFGLNCDMSLTCHNTSENPWIEMCHEIQTERYFFFLSTFDKNW